jgi:hypothetical protein
MGQVPASLVSDRIEQFRHAGVFHLCG